MNATTATVGCDLGDRFSHLCVLDLDGRVVGRERVRTTPAALESFFARPRARVILEAGSQSPWVARLVQAAGHEVVVANPRQLPLITKSSRKTDRNDAEKLARIGRLDVALLAPVKHRSAASQHDLAIVRARDVLVRERTQLVNHTRGIVKLVGARLPSCYPEALPKRARAQLPVELAPALGPILDVIESLNAQIKQYDVLLAERAQAAYPDAELLQQVNGVGLLTALTFVLTLEDPSRFKRSRDVGPFLGLVPIKDESGDDDPQRGITKTGDLYLRKLLVQCAHHILGHLGRDSDLRRWGLALAARGGKNAKKRAAVAVARRLAVLLHRLWCTGEVYQPLGYATPRVTAA